MRPSWLRFDFLLFFAVLALVLVGLTVIYSATVVGTTQGSELLDTPFGRQGLLALVGVVLALGLAALDYHILGYHPLASLSPITKQRHEPTGLGLSLHHDQYSEVEREEHRLGIRETILLVVEAMTNPLYILTLALLLAVFVFGKSSGGAQRWLDLGFFDLQPSELAKLLLIIVVARYLSDHEDSLDHVHHMVITLVQVAVPAVLIARQPDLGTALTLVAIWLGMVFMAGIRRRHLFALALTGLAAAPLAWLHFLTEYQKERLIIFLNPQLDPLGAGYNIIQSRISVGSGGLFGRGLNSGTQSQLNFLRIQHTDYIFAVLAEEMGFIGGMVIIALYALLIFQILTVAGRSRDTFGRLIACGIASMLVFQVFVNIGMNIGLSPVTGIPLPFISYGRSSLLTLLLCVGILESIAVRRKPDVEPGNI